MGSGGAAAEATPNAEAPLSRARFTILRWAFLQAGMLIAAGGEQVYQYIHAQAIPRQQSTLLSVRCQVMDELEFRELPAACYAPELRGDGEEEGRVMLQGLSEECSASEGTAVMGSVPNLPPTPPSDPSPGATARPWPLHGAPPARSAPPQASDLCTRCRMRGRSPGGGCLSCEPGNASIRGTSYHKAGSSKGAALGLSTLQPR